MEPCEKMTMPTPEQEAASSTRVDSLNLKAMSMKVELEATILLYRAAALRMDDKLCQELRDKCHAQLDTHLDFAQQAVDTVLITYGHKK